MKFSLCDTPLRYGILLKLRTCWLIVQLWAQSLTQLFPFYQKKKPSGQAEAIVKESIDSDKLIHAENRGNQNEEEQSNRGSPGVVE